MPSLSPYSCFHHSANIAGAAFVGGENLNRLTLAQQDIAQRGVLDRVGLRRTRVEPCLRRAFEQCVDVKSGDCDRKQPDRRQHRIATSDVVGDDEGLVTLFLREREQLTLRPVSGDEYASARAVLTVAAFEQLTEKAEGGGRLGGLTRFGDDIDADTLTFVAAESEQVLRIESRKPVSREPYVRPIVRQNVVKLRPDELDRGARSKIRAPYADYNENIAGRTDFFGGALYSGAFFGIFAVQSVIIWKIDPTEKIRAGAAPAR